MSSAMLDWCHGSFCQFRIIQQLLMSADYMRSKRLTVKAIGRIFNGDVGERVTGRTKEMCILLALEQLDQHPQLVTRLRLHCASKDAAGYMFDRSHSGRLVLRQAIRNIRSHRDTGFFGERETHPSSSGFITSSAMSDWCRGSSSNFAYFHNYLCP